MNKSFVEKAKERLINRRQEIVRITQSNSEIEDNSAPDSKIKDSADEAQSASMHMLQEAIESSGLNELRSIDRALLRLQTGNYGLCVDCKKEISEKRLEFFPYAERCVTCQQRFES